MLTIQCTTSLVPLQISMIRFILEVFMFSIMFLLCFILFCTNTLQDLICGIYCSFGFFYVVIMKMNAGIAWVLRRGLTMYVFLTVFGSQWQCFLKCIKNVKMCCIAPYGIFLSTAVCNSSMFLHAFSKILWESCFDLLITEINQHA